jgi:hypothetical protein
MDRTGKTEFKLYMGRNYADFDGADNEVNQLQIDRFIKWEVSPILVGFTVIDGQGYWKAVPERTIIIIFIGDDEDRAKVRRVGQAYKAIFNQESVYMTESRIMMEVI